MARKNKHIEEIEAAQNMVPQTDLVVLASSLVASYVEHNQCPVAEIPSFMRTIHTTMVELKNGVAPPPESKPAVSVKKSVSDEFIVCLHDGKKLTMLKRYLRTHYNQSPEEYRKQFDLPHDYPMVAPAYARLRSAFAKKIGLGRVPQENRRGRKPKNEKGTLYT